MWGAFFPVSLIIAVAGNDTNGEFTKAVITMMHIGATSRGGGGEIVDLTSTVAISILQPEANL